MQTFHFVHICSINKYIFKNFSRYSQATNYPYNNYENNIHMQHYHYRDSSRYAPEWPHDKRTGDYRRSNYDRRPSN